MSIQRQARSNHTR